MLDSLNDVDTKTGSIIKRAARLDVAGDQQELLNVTIIQDVQKGCTFEHLNKRLPTTSLS